jgi:hypothetical protein
LVAHIIPCSEASFPFLKILNLVPRLMLLYARTPVCYASHVHSCQSCYKTLQEFLCHSFTLVHDLWPRAQISARVRLSRPFASAHRASRLAGRRPLWRMIALIRIRLRCSLRWCICRHVVFMPIRRRWRSIRMHRVRTSSSAIAVARSIE